MYQVAVYLALVVCATAHGHDHGQHDRGLDHSHQHEALPKQPIAVSPSGEFRGSYNVTRRGRRFEAYQGIKYAEAPVGELRFQPPKAIDKYESPVDASKDGPSCPRPTSKGYPQDEDCLTINVYTPLKSDRSKPLPVIFFIHPGGFYTFTGRSDITGPNYLLDRDVVFVTINYRLGSLGFLSTGDKLAPGNNGFKDQVIALKWVQKNIAAFGGDPNCVTITGYSAGSHSVALHVVSPMSTGLFHRAISMSGSPVRKVPSPHDLYRLAVRQAELVNCPTTNTSIIIDCLKTKHWRDLGNSLRGFFEFGSDPVTLWEPVVENDFGQERFLPIQPLDAIKQGKINAVPYIISQTRDEFFYFAFNPLRNETLRKQFNEDWDRVAPIAFVLPRENATIPARILRKEYLDDQPLVNDEETAKKLGRLYGDATTGFPVHRLANLMCRHSPQPVWYYEFNYIGNHSHYEDPNTKKPVGVAHHDDLIYLLSLRYRFPDVGLEGEDAMLLEKMTAIWYNFARYGDPNPRGDTPELGSLRWPAMTPAERTYLRIDQQLTLHQRLKEDRLKLWDKLYPIEY